MLREKARSKQEGYELALLEELVPAKLHGPQLGMPDIEDLLGLSSSSVKRLFNEAYEYGLSHYIESVRLQRACELLTSEKNNIGDIATTVGYTSLVSFSRAFKRVFGISPIQYRGAYRA